MTFPDFLQNMLQILQNAQGSDSAATARGKRGSKKSSIRATRNLRRSARFAEEAEPAAAKRTSFASSCSGGGSSGGGGVTDEEKKQLLRFRGFEANDAGKECICCYQVANITVNFMCEVSEGSTEHETSLYKFAEVMLSLLLLLEHTLSLALDQLAYFPGGLALDGGIFASGGQSNAAKHDAFVVPSSRKVFAIALRNARQVGDSLRPL